MKNKIVLLTLVMLQMVSFSAIYSMRFIGKSMKASEPQKNCIVTLGASDGSISQEVHVDIQYKGCLILYPTQRAGSVSILYDTDKDLQNLLQKNNAESFEAAAKFEVTTNETTGALSVLGLKNYLSNEFGNRQLKSVAISLKSDSQEYAIPFSIAGFINPDSGFISHNSKKEPGKKPYSNPIFSKPKILLGLGVLALATFGIIYFLHNKGYKIPFIL